LKGTYGRLEKQKNIGCVVSILYQAGCVFVENAHKLGTG